MSRHEDLLLQLIQREPDKIRSILGLPAPKPDLSWYEGADVWIEAGHRSDRAAELRIAFGEPLPHGYADFWIPFSGPDGNALGWLRFSYITTVREKSMFTACEWRSASEPAPAKERRLDLPMDWLPKGFEPEPSKGASDYADQQPVEQIPSSALRHLEESRRTLAAYRTEIEEEARRQLSEASSHIETENNAEDPANSMAAAARIIAFIQEYISNTQSCSQMDALWLAFLGLNGPAAAKQVMECYLPMTSRS
ncbi:hypothetical protein P4154_30095 [Pseudomonas aeruginosa]|nr:hypothetical protein [Pseudomonas aeruginosa]